MRFLGALLAFLFVGLFVVDAAPSIIGKYTIQDCPDVDPKQPSCCCILGSINLSGSDGASSVSIAAQLRAACPGGERNPPSIPSGLSLVKQANGVYSTRTTIRGESFSIEVAGETVHFRNTAPKAATCNFAAQIAASTAGTGTGGNDSNSRPTAKPCTNPTKEQVTACINNWNSLPACEEKNEEKHMNTETCCPICRPSVIPPRPKCSMEDVDRCPNNGKPLFNNVTGCPSCILPAPGKDCPNADAIPSVKCPPGVPPARTANSCVSCKVTKENDQCNKENRKECEKAIAAGLIPVCESGEESTFNISSCCRTCIKPDDNDKGPADKLRCTKEEMNACMATVPVCQDGEKPFANKTKCCPSCRRPERGCKIGDVSACKASQRLCASGELPSHIDGECCATCKLAPPTCTPACNSSAICVPNVVPGATADQIQNAPGKCLAKGKIRAKFNVKLAGGAVDKDSIVAIITEIINRYCDRTENTDKCTQLTAVLNAITLTLNSADPSSGNVDATIEYSNQIPAGESTSSASFALSSYSHHVKLLADSNDSGALVTAALNDPASTDTVTVTSVTIDDGNNNNSGVAAVYPSILVGAFAVVVAFLKY